MKPASEEQIEAWIAECVRAARCELPPDHPKHERTDGPGLLPAGPILRAAKVSRNKLERRNIYDPAKIEALANDGVDLAKVRADNAAKRQLDTARRELVELVKDADLAQIEAARRQLVLLPKTAEDQKVKLEYKLTPELCRLAGELLSVAVRNWRGHDFDLSKVAGYETRTARVNLDRVLCEWTGDPSEHDPNGQHSIKHGFLLMSFCAEALRTAAGEPSALLPEERTTIEIQRGADEAKGLLERLEAAKREQDRARAELDATTLAILAHLEANRVR